MTREELIEAIARAMCVYQDRDPDRVLESMDKDRKPVIMWTHWKGEATAALAALEAAGVRLVYVGEAQAQLIDGDERTTVRIFTPYAPPGVGGE
jgi:hypothetical protein